MSGLMKGLRNGGGLAMQTGRISHSHSPLPAAGRDDLSWTCVRSLSMSSLPCLSVLARV